MTNKLGTTLNPFTGELDRILKNCPGATVGLKTLENWLLYSADFTNAVWTTTNTTVTPETGYTTITQTAPAEAFISQDAVPDTSGKLLTVLIVCKPVSVYKQNVKIVIEDSSGEIGSSEWILPLGEYTTIRVRATRASVSDVNINFENPNSVASFGLDIEKTQLFTSVVEGIYNTGDSIALAAYDEITPPGIFPGQCYSMLYANVYNLENNQTAVGLSYLDDIKTRMLADLPGNNYPIIMIEGGGVDVIFAAVSPVSDMLDDIREIVELARASTDTIALLTIPPMPVFTTEEAVWAILYNSAITAEYADSETVTVVNLSFLTADKFNFGTHVTLEGHVEIFSAINAAITIPYYVETYKFIETEGLPSEEIYNQYSSNIHIDWTNTDKNFKTTGSARVDGGLGIGADAKDTAFINVDDTYTGAAGFRGISVNAILEPENANINELSGVGGFTVIGNSNSTGQKTSGLQFRGINGLVFGMLNTNAAGITIKDGAGAVILGCNSVASVLTATNLWGQIIVGWTGLAASLVTENLYGLEIWDSASGLAHNITNQYGIKIRKPTRGTNNYQACLDGVDVGSGIWLGGKNGVRIYTKTGNEVVMTGGRVGVPKRITNADSPYTVLATDHKIFCDTDGGAITLLLPVGVNGTQYVFINCDATSSGNLVTVTPNGAELLDGVNASKSFGKGKLVLDNETTEGWW